MQRRRVAIATQSGQMIFLTAIDRMIPYVRKRFMVRQTLSIADAVERENRWPRATAGVAIVIRSAISSTPRPEQRLLQLVRASE